MNMMNYKKAVLVGILILTASSAFCGEKKSPQLKEGFIPQMMEQFQGRGFTLTGSRSNTALQIIGTRFSPLPKVVMTFRFGA